MTELYINNRLCDLGREFSVRINRQLINPSELNTKDAQYSYSISLPTTANNNDILNYANVEEVTGKFNNIYNATLNVNGVRVFDGNFRLSGVTADGYKGNLYVPAPKSIKDLFGDKKLNENESWLVDFMDFAASVNEYNTKERAACIFPYTLYGVLPKHPVDDSTDLNVWDNSVKTGVQDFPPSVNVVQLLEHIFGEKGYKLSGSALTDDRLTKLHMSYRNETDYVQPWNWGHLGKIHIKGEWTNFRQSVPPCDMTDIERGVEEYSGEDGKTFSVDLLNCNFANIVIEEDNGKNIAKSTTADDEGRVWNRHILTIPVAGFYKVELTACCTIVNGKNCHYDPTTDVKVAEGGGDFLHARHGVKLLRDRRKGTFDLETSRMDGVYYRDNLPQNDVYDFENSPKYAPAMDVDGDVLFVDAAQNHKYVVGFQWGKRNDSDVNPTDKLGLCAQINAAKPSISWDGEDRELTRLAIMTPGYRKWAKIGDTEVLDWVGTSKWSIQLIGAFSNFSERGRYDSNAPVSKELNARGAVNCVVWLEAGERLTVVDIADNGQFFASANSGFLSRGWPVKTTKFDLKITPFRTDPGWLRIDRMGKCTGNMFWDYPVNFDTEKIDLVKFLPADVKTDDFIDNFCKAFNLQLSQTGPRAFELNVKQKGGAVSNLYIDLDNLASVRDRVNSPLGMPSLYKLGFTVNTDEEGHFMTKDDGGGEIRTGATEEKTIEQKSTFSYNWFKNITKTEPNGNVFLPLAVISKHEVWAGDKSYAEAMKKRFPNLALRFWYKAGLLNDLGASFYFNNTPLYIAKVSNELPGRCILNYDNRRLTILDNFYTVLVDAGSHYTEIEGYLRPEQYAELGVTRLARFNGDIYYAAEISAYDPEGRNKTKIKLLKKKA